MSSTNGSNLLQHISLTSFLAASSNPACILGIPDHWDPLATYAVGQLQTVFVNKALSHILGNRLFAHAVGFNDVEGFSQWLQTVCGSLYQNDSTHKPVSSAFSNPIDPFAVSFIRQVDGQEAYTTVVDFSGAVIFDAVSHKSYLVLHGPQRKQHFETSEQQLEPFDPRKDSPISFSDEIMQSNCGQLLLNHDWESTPLGAMQTWSAELKTAVSICFASPYKAALWWGTEATIMYNDKYAEIVGAKHPHIFGQSGPHAWSELWGDLVGEAHNVFAGKVVAKEDNMIPMMTGSDNSLEETYHSWSYSPIYRSSADGQKAQVLGFLNTTIDRTNAIIAARRLKTVHLLGQYTAASRTAIEYFEGATRALSTNPYDVPYFMIYSCSYNKPASATTYSGSNPHQSSANKKTTNSTSSTAEDADETVLSLSLVGTVGIPEDHKYVPRHHIIDLDAITQEFEPTANDSLPFPIGQACKFNEPMYLRTPERFVEDFERRSWGEISNGVVCIPISIGLRPNAVLVMGLNTRRPYNERYSDFTGLIRRTLSTGLSTVKAVESEVARMVEMQKLDSAKTSFFESVSHELRTPLTLISGPANDGYEDKRTEVANRTRFKLIRKAAARLLRLVNSLLEVSALEAGKVTARYRPVNFTAVVKDLSSLFRSQIERTGLSFDVVVKDNRTGTIDDEVVFLDIISFEKVIYNLLSNALKYTTQGGITVTVSSSKSHCILEVADTGKGIPKSDIDLVFHRFHRVYDNSEHRSVEGTGIGLSLCYELVKLHNGNIKLISKVSTPERQGGSRFIISFPKGTSHLKSSMVDMDAEPLESMDGAFTNQGIADETLGWATADSDDDASVSGKSSTNREFHVASGSSGMEAQNDFADIMVVDDNADLRAYICSILSPWCRTLITKPDGQAALDWLRKSDKLPDIVILDVMMPRLDGWGLLEAIRSTPKLSKIPVIMLSAKGGNAASTDALERGASEYIHKPFNASELKARCNTQLNISRNRNRLEQLVADRTQELAQSDRRAEVLLAASPVAIFEASLNGLITYINSSFRTLTGYEDDVPLRLESLMERIHPDYRQITQTAWDIALDEKSVGLQVQNARKPGACEIQFLDGSWALLETFLLDDVGVIGALTSLTTQKALEKRALEHEKRQVEDAHRLVRNQEAFIDIVSHELRNPISAILQASEISLDTFRNLDALLQEVAETTEKQSIRDASLQARHDVAEGIDSCQSIILCTRHQSIIASDILSSSRLDQGMLSATPIDFVLMREIQNVLGMFEMQTAGNNIALRVNFGAGVTKDLACVADPTRLAQIVVNLISNSCRILETWSGERYCTIEVHLSTCKPDLTRLHMQDNPPFQSLLTPIPDDLPIGSEFYLCFVVRDSGPGISASDKGRLFTKFNRVDDSKTEASKRGGGSGLGLYLARKLAELQGGEIDVRSSEGHGAEFVFYIVAKRGTWIEPKRRIRDRTGFVQFTTSSASTSPNPQNRQDNKSPLTQVGTSEESIISNLDISQPATTRTNTRILCVDDNPMNVKLLQRQLTKAGLVSDAAHNGLEALQHLERVYNSGDRNLWPDLILMDLEMPVMGGIECVKKIREAEQEGRFPVHVPVHALTGNARQFYIDEAKAAGMQSVFTKPYSLSSVLEQIDLVIAAKVSSDKILSGIIAHFYSSATIDGQMTEQPDREKTPTPETIQQQTTAPEVPAAQESEQVTQLVAIFPQLDIDTIKTVLDAHSGNVEAASTSLLEMSNPSDNPAPTAETQARNAQEESDAAYARRLMEEEHQAVFNRPLGESPPQGYNNLPYEPRRRGGSRSAGVPVQDGPPPKDELEQITDSIKEFADTGKKTLTTLFGKVKEKASTAYKDFESARQQNAGQSQQQPGTSTEQAGAARSFQLPTAATNFINQVKNVAAPSTSTSAAQNTSAQTATSAKPANKTAAPANNPSLANRGYTVSSPPTAATDLSRLQQSNKQHHADDDDNESLEYVKNPFEEE